MFSGCSSLIKVPSVLHATTLADYCYYSMFYSCESLVKAPLILPATTLAVSCYYAMFYNCTSLVEAPELPAATLVGSCYYNMFNGCSSLSYIKMMATDISSTSNLTSWVSGVSSTGTFVKNTAMTSLPTGISGIPEGWTVEDASS